MELEEKGMKGGRREAEKGGRKGREETLIGASLLHVDLAEWSRLGLTEGPPLQLFSCLRCCEGIAT